MLNNELAAKDYKSTKTRLSKIRVSDLTHGIANTNLAIIPNDKQCFGVNTAEEQRIGRNKSVLDIAEKEYHMNRSKTRIFGLKKGPHIIVEFEKGKLDLFKTSYTELDFNTHKEINSNIRYVFKGTKVIKINLKECTAKRI